MVDAAVVIRDNIVQRTRGGVSSEGGQFQSYSERHSKRRRSRGLPVTPPDLWFTGTMLNNLSVTSSSGVRIDLRGRGSKLRGQAGNAGQFAAMEKIEPIVIGFTDPVQEKKAYRHEMGSGPPRRPFLGFSPQDADTMIDFVGRAFDAQTRSAGYEQIELVVTG
jgi:hypothetical protein